MFAEELNSLSKKFSLLVEKININQKKNELGKLEDLIHENQLNYDLNIKNFKEKKFLETKINKFDEIEKNLKVIQGTSEDEFTILHDEILKEIERLNQEIDKLYVELCFTEESDFSNCFLEINTGAGGIDSQDWSSILLRMYLGYLNKNEKFKFEIIDKSEEDVGIKSALIRIEGDFAYGTFKHETGIHRLVRISPFNANDKRQTSFCGIFVFPEVDENIDIAINEKDLRIDVFRSSGAGGQSVNKTESAVRITHIPTGIVATSQQERSQIQNRANAMKVLKSRIYEVEKDKINNSKSQLESIKKDISWGNQVRNYVMHPYQLVKDLRSGYETSKITNVLNGNIDEFLTQNILHNK